ncbi:anaerobic sulfatase maturase [candidate division KSB1 bacterium]
MLYFEKPLNSVLIKPAGPDCNMHCEYCFYLGKADMFDDSKMHRMSEKILEELVRQIMAQNVRDISFAWQGGEPTLMGLQFFRKAVEFQRKYGQGKTVGNGLQTNGILLDENWAEFFREYSFLIGLSIDGPEYVHDKYRAMSGGKNSFDKVHDKVKMLLGKGVEVNALSVINNYSVQFPEEIYGFFKSEGLNYMQFIPCVEPDNNNPGKPAGFTVGPEDYGRFLCKIFDLWIGDFRYGEPTTSIRFFDSVFYNYAGMVPPECTLLHVCGNYVVIEHNGDVYSCDFFVDPDWKLGNIMSGNIIAMLNSDLQNAFGRAKSFLPEDCRSCSWLRYCWGGCPKDRKLHKEKAGLNYLCEAFKMFFEHSDPEFRKLAEQWQKKQVREDNSNNNSRAAVPEGKTGRNKPCPCGSGKKYKNCCENK